MSTTVCEQRVHVEYLWLPKPCVGRLRARRSVAKTSGERPVEHVVRVRLAPRVRPQPAGRGESLLAHVAHVRPLAGGVPVSRARRLGRVRANLRLSSRRAGTGERDGNTETPTEDHVLRRSRLGRRGTVAVTVYAVSDAGNGTSGSKKGNKQQLIGFTRNT